MKAVELAVEIRQAAGKKNKALRRAGQVPANIVSHGKESVAIQTEYNHLLKVLQKVGYTQPVLIKAGDSDHTVLVTEVKFVPAKNTVEHVTFQEVKKGMGHRRGMHRQYGCPGPNGSRLATACS